jgi:hypothetical protein
MMPRSREVEKTWAEDDLPIVGELTNCRQFTASVNKKQM